MMKQPNRRNAALVALLCLLALLVSINVIAANTLRSARLDLTQGKLYTLSDGSRSILSKLEEPVVLRFYYSPALGTQIPSYGVYAQRVREMLEEYAALSKGKLELQILNPEPFSPAEDRAVAFGLQGVPLDNGGEQVYFGLAATNSTDDTQTVPFFQPDRERFLEYDLTKLVRNLAFPKKTVVAMISTLPLEGDMMAAMQGQAPQPYAVIDQLRQLNEMRTLGGDIDKIADDVDVLMVVHPKELSQKTLYAIDQFVLRGGRALVFVDPNSETQAAHANRMMPPGSPTNSDFNKLFAAWGFQMDIGQVAADRQSARRVNAGTQARPQAADYVAWLSLKKANMNRDDSITGDLDQINIATGGVLRPLDGAKTTFTPLLSTSTDAMEVQAEKVQNVPDVLGLLRDFKPLNQKLAIAARISGPAVTAFPDGPPPNDDVKLGPDGKPVEEKPDPVALRAAAEAQLKTSAQPINVVAVADTDILDERYWAQVQEFFGQRVVVPIANNADFIANAIDVLAGGNDMIGLRSRGSSARPFTVIRNMQRDAEDRYQATQKDLEDKLKAAQDKIKELQSKDASGGTQLTAEQTSAIENFRGEMIRIRQQLRDVQRALRQDIDGLKAVLQFIDISLIPILVGFAAIILGAVRLQRRKRRAAA